MANHIKQPIILDFFGLPGCGKSTVSHQLAEMLRKKGYKVYEPSYDTDHCLSSRKRKLSKMVCFLAYAVAHPIKTIELIHQICSAGNDAISAIGLAMIVVVRTQEINKHDSGIIILDQGVVQLAISICQKSFSTLNLSKTMEMVLSFILPQKNIHKIYIEVGVDTALKRSEQRGTTVSRMDREKDTIKKRKIMEYYANASYQFLDQATVVIDGEELVQLELDHLLHYMEEQT